MMRITTNHPDITPIPVQWAETACNECIFPHLSMPKRGPKGKLGSHRLLNLILWVLYTGMPWQCWPMPKGPTGTPDIHDTNVYRAFATWADDGSRQQAFIASVGHLSDEKKLDLRVRHGDGTNTVAKKGVMASGPLGINTRRARQSSQSQTTMALCCRPFPSLQSMKRLWCGYLMD
jgi:transposase